MALFMKNTFYLFNLILIIGIAFMFVSCEDKTSQKNEGNLPVPNSSVKEKKTPALVKDNQPIDSKPEKNGKEKNGAVVEINKKPNFDITDIATNFKQFQKLNSEPIYVDPNFSMDCDSDPANLEEESIKENGPHRDAAINIYMNNLATETFKNKTFPYPVGSIIIKDKNALSSAELNNTNKGVGGMLKREKGFDSENGDWEYFFFKDVNKIDKGKIDSCIQCHTRASKKDYVFGKWRKQIEEEKANAKNGAAVEINKKPNFDITDIATNFKQLQKMNEKPIHVDPNFAMKCSSWSMMEEKKSQEENGPHKDAAIDIYMNSLAAEAFKNKSFPYPVGAIVIKDKNALSSAELNNTNKGVGGMLKREKGFDSEHGDWEYFFFKDVNKIDKGKIDSCIQCHSRASEKDYVFGKWRKQIENNK